MDKEKENIMLTLKILGMKAEEGDLTYLALQGLYRIGRLNGMLKMLDKEEK